MENDVAQQRQEAHLLIDVLTEDKLFAVRTLLNVLVEPLSRSLAMAPMDDEELNDETIAAIERSRLQFRRGEGIPHEEIMREFGL